MIALTLSTGHYIAINPAHIVAITGDHASAQLILANGHEYFVQESPATILERIEQRRVAERA